MLPVYPVSSRGSSVDFSISADLPSVFSQATQRSLEQFAQESEPARNRCLFEKNLLSINGHAERRGYGVGQKASRFVLLRRSPIPTDGEFECFGVERACFVDQGCGRLVDFILDPLYNPG